MLAEVAGGTQTAVINTEHTLATLTTGKTYVLVTSTANLVAGDTLILRIYTKVRAGGASTLAYAVVFANLQSENVKYSVPVPANVEFLATLQQIEGVGRAFVWAVLSLD